LGIYLGTAGKQVVSPHVDWHTRLLDLRAEDTDTSGLAELAAFVVEVSEDVSLTMLQPVRRKAYSVVEILCSLVQF
jgi:hypothetical protein